MRFSLRSRRVSHSLVIWVVSERLTVSRPPAGRPPQASVPALATCLWTSELCLAGWRVTTALFSAMFSPAGLRAGALGRQADARCHQDCQPAGARWSGEASGRWPRAREPRLQTLPRLLSFVPRPVECPYRGWWRK